jgi:aspartate racemase
MHKRIGILGGMSPESTVEYYQYITRTYTERYGDYGYPEVLIYSVSFQSYAEWSEQGHWNLIAHGLSNAARGLEAAGADFLLIATNTMHLVIDEVRASVGIPVLSLLDAVGDAIQEMGLERVGLLGTRYTMEKGLYQNALAGHEIEVLIPDREERAYVNAVIYDELVAGKIHDASRAGFVGIIRKLSERGAQGIVLGCTEIPLLVGEQDAGMPVFNTTQIHAEAALSYALQWM